MKWLDGLLGRSPVEDRVDPLIAEGNRREDAGDAAGACELYREVMRVAPTNPRGPLNLGIALAALGELDAAAQAYEKVLALDPGHAFGNYNYACLAYRRGDPLRAEALARRALAGKADLVDARILLANVLAERGDTDAALVQLDDALRFNPKHAGAHFNRALVLHQAERLEEARLAAERAFELDSGYHEAAVLVSTILRAQGFPLESSPWIRLARQLAPERLDLWSRELFGLNFDEHASMQALFEAHRAYGAQLERTVAPVFDGRHLGSRDPDRRIRVGLISGDFCVHPVSLFLLPLLRWRDRERVEIVCYSSTANPDHITDSIRSMADHWVGASGLTDAQLAARIHADAVDVLVDLAGHTGSPRLAVFAAKPAPVQLTWLGYLNTTGLSRIDYRLCDVRTDPPESARWHTEKLWHLPDSQWCYRPFVDVPAPTEAPLERNGYVTFGSFNQRSKITPAMCERWAALMQRVEKSRLLVADVHSQAKRQAIVAAMSRAGVAAERVEFVERVDLPDYYRLFERVDIALDTFPYGGGTTTFDSLWMGVPVVTAVGPQPASRSAASILSLLGLDDWIASTVDTYVDVAVRAAERTDLSSLRATLRARLQGSPVTDEPRFARNCEIALRAMWQRHCGRVASGGQEA
jgi:predicted O-linked N-acetylglucosamine transferase (SPINDLY family)